MVDEIPPGTPPAAVELPALPQNWQAGLPEDIRGEESLKMYQDIPSMVKSLVHAQKQFGADKIAIPSKFATEDDWRAIYQKLGLPQDVKDYSLDVPKELGFEGDRLAEFKAAAHKAGIFPKQLQALMQFHSDDSKKAMNANEQKIQAELKAGQEALKQEWGEAHDKKIAQAKYVVKTLNDPKLVEFLEKSKLGDHPQMIKVFSKLGEMLGEKNVAGLGNEVGQFGNVKTPEVARKEIATVQGNPEHPYNNGKHPGHHLAVKEMEALFSQAFPHTDT